MALSIFNSERRVQLTILSAIVVTVPLALLNFATHVNLSRGKGGTDAERNFWQYKLRPSEKYDIVCLGDSRTLMGINPEFLEIELHCKAYNASFAAGSLNEVIFQHIDNNFLSRIPGRPKAVVIGLTPLTMGQDSRNNALFESTKLELEKKRFSVIDNFEQVFFKKIRSKHIKRLFKKTSETKVYHKNGHLERFAKVRKKAQLSGLRFYDIYLAKYKFSQQSKNEMLTRIKAWTREGITVFVFRPPVNASMDKLENKSKKINFASMRKQIEAAGGVWIEIEDRSSYNSYDSSHLSSEEARRFSKYLARKIGDYYRQNLPK